MKFHSLLKFTGFMIALTLANLASANKTASTELIIIGGGKTFGEAEKIQNKFRYLLSWPVEAPDGLPLATSSDSIKGLNPGFKIVILGGCAHAEAQKISKLLQKDFPGTYTKAVIGVSEQFSRCPHVAAPTPEQKALVEKAKANPNSASDLYNLAVHLKDNSMLFQAQWIVDRILEIDPNHSDAKNLGEMISTLQTN